MKNGKRLLAVLLVVLMVAMLFTACKKEESTYYSVIAKGFQHQFWQVVKDGSEQAAKDLGVEIFFTGPEGESAQAAQVDMINAELAKNPAAIALAALNTEAVLSQLQEAYDKGIPIIGFDSGVPNAPAGQIAANASTNNENAAAIGAEHMFEAIKDKIAAATVDAPVTVVCLSQDATSASVTGRSKGFSEKMYALVTGSGQSAAISGDFAAITTGDPNAVAVNVKIVVGATPDITDMTNAASGVLNTDNLLGVFCSNEGAVNGLLAAVNAGSAIPSGVQLVGFDAGAGQKAAVRNGTFLGSITQDPFQIGYKAVELAVKASKGEAVSDVDTGAKWYDSSNMDDAGIANLLYD
ncbi:MAG: ABC transporter substrate-binding protein [Clostridia bacterium]|jgi:ribose transport system substrate-binding protein|nr:ABC transporter substrate-binding protein [Clostridia bacterium]